FSRATHLLISFSNAPSPPETYPLPLHDALPISARRCTPGTFGNRSAAAAERRTTRPGQSGGSAWPGPASWQPSRFPDRLSSLRRSEEHTSELQSRENLVCRLLLEKKKNKTANNN